MPTIEIQIAASPQILFELFESKRVQAGMTREIPGGRLTLQRMPMEKRDGNILCAGITRIQLRAHFWSGSGVKPDR